MGEIIRTIGKLSLAVSLHFLAANIYAAESATATGAVAQPRPPSKAAAKDQRISSDPATAADLDALGDKLHRALDRYYARKQQPERLSPWQVLHWTVAFGTNTFLDRGPSEPPVSAAGWLCWNGRCKQQAILYLDRQGRLSVMSGPGVQGHEGQLLAYLAQSRLGMDYPIRIDGKEFTLADLVEYEKRTCRPRTELTFKLIGLAHYLPADAKWKSDAGADWSIERLIAEELAQPVIGAACGGTHRMMGFTVAVERGRVTGEPLAGEFLRAEKFVDDYHRYAWSLQNPDGSFSTEYFRRRSAAGTNDKKLETSGHTMEWLAYSLSDEQLRQRRTVAAVEHLAELLLAEPDRDWPMGPLGHGLHALVLYEQRVFGAWSPKR